MSDTEGYRSPTGQAGALALRDDDDQYGTEFDFGAAVAWLRQHSVLVGGLAIIIGEIIWKAQFLSRMFFSQDDYVNLDIAIKSPFNWHYLSLIGAGHFYPGLRAITWVLARVSLYDWGLDAGVALTFVALASLAALRLLRTLFGDRPVILVPLAIYALIPLTMPDLSWWWCAMESLPFQLAIFMSLNAHVRYVRTGGRRSLCAATVWLAVGLLFFEKAVMLAPLLFLITAAFLMGPRTWLGGALASLRRYWPAWLIYAVITAAYIVVFFAALHASGQQAHAPRSLSATGNFALTITKDTLTTGALGGPWRWLPLADQQYALAAPPTAAVLFAGLVAVAVLAVSIGRRFVAWRAWAILVFWVVCADMIPVIFGRLLAGLQTVLGLETRYLADAACVLAICLGLAFLPVAGTETSEATAEAGQRASGGHRANAPSTHQQNLRYAASALVAIFVVSSIWSVHTYENITPGGPAARTYFANAKRAVQLAPPGTVVLDQYMPQQLVEGLFGKQEAVESTVIGDLEQGTLARKFRWVGKAEGTIDGLHMFGSDGKLYPALISGVYSVPRTGAGFKACWPERKGMVRVRFPHRTTIYDWTLRLEYIWGSPAGSATLWYGGIPHPLTLQHGPHSVYLSVSGNVTRFRVVGLGQNGLCITRAEAGELVAYGTPIP
jgi:hypothetical protein